MVASPRRMRLLLALLAGLFALTGCLKTDSSVTGNLAGKVFDANGHVLRGARVELYGGDHATTTDELGRYRIYGIAPGQRKVVATYQGRSVVKIFEVPRGGTLENADLIFDAIDGLPPIITDVAVVDLGQNSARITWKTNEPADSIVDYATGPIGLGSYTFQATDSALLTDHSLTLANLRPNATYHFRVRSRDFAGNEGVSSDYQFMTLAGDPPAPVANFAIAPPTEMERVVLTWTSNTEPDLVGYNLYRSESRNGPFARVNADPIPSGATTTTWRDDGLKIGVKYYYYVRAVDQAGNESPQSTTLAVVTPGSLPENRTWKAAESPYILTGDLRVRGGVVLTIEPGVEVKFTQSDSLPDVNGGPMADLIVQGGLLAVGTPDRRIIFTSAESFPSKGNWGGIKFLSTNEPENQLKFITLLFADTGVRSEGSTPAIENSEFGLCGVGLDLGLSTALNVRYNTIRDCDLGIVSANSNIRNNLFIKNQVGAGLLGADRFEYNTVDCLIGVEVPFGTPVISNNIIAYTGTGKALYGINQTQPTATPTISFNDIWNYTFATNGLTVATGPGNIASDPLFIGGSPFDYHLQTVAGGYASDSPCLTAGESGTQMGRYGP
ncbi:MAG: Large exoproteins involved in heme utilization or adhesion [Candidatus Ozemobacter sibiricus]|uniref:Large exoproteins involved in heme utilization or adhesion n=1 Tax=Candidatus Ozemobacter sibiricus TaxID=2268124 RepID=A0A367ZJX5_9BACT|nr:MAG: Large exoproteins involved in heme utilization or adhesion [Candidatus Ozemobacter sibiricus]